MINYHCQLLVHGPNADVNAFMEHVLDLHGEDGYTLTLERTIKAHTNIEKIKKWGTLYQPTDTFTEWPGEPGPTGSTRSSTRGLISFKINSTPPGEWLYTVAKSFPKVQLILRSETVDGTVAVIKVQGPKWISLAIGVAPFEDNIAQLGIVTNAASYIVNGSGLVREASVAG